MTTVRMIAAHEIVRQTYPRPPPEERDHVAMAIGKAIDGTLAECGHQLRLGRRPTQTALTQLAETLLSDSLAEAAVALDAPTKARTLTEIQDVIRAYRKSEIAGLARPKTRVILIGGSVGVYAQPDYWDGRGRFFEMKSYRAIPLAPDVALQVRLFQLAFPTCEAVLVCLDRHARPVETSSAVVPRPSEEEAASTLRLAYDLGSRLGQEKVLEYLEGPFVHYHLPPPPADAATSRPDVPPQGP